MGILGTNYGFLRGMLIACGVPFDEAAPHKWQKAMGCLTHGDKNVSKAKAQQLYPGLKVTHATADALLIASYCWMLRHGPEFSQAASRRLRPPADGDDGAWTEGTGAKQMILGDTF
jgi:hypothetical protein